MFRFKQFTIQQQSVSMKVNTDGVLLGAWTDVEHVARILDVGAGTGVIALMLAQRTPNAAVDAVEIDEASARQAQENAQNSRWKNRITVFCQSFQDFARQPGMAYDLVVSNPPYFVDALLPPSAGRAQARHAGELTHEALIFYASKILTPSGKLGVVLPVEEGLRFIEAALANAFHLTRKTTVFPIKNKPPKRLLLQFSLIESTLTEDTLSIHEENGTDYMEEYKALTNGFYLKF